MSTETDATPTRPIDESASPEVISEQGSSEEVERRTNFEERQHLGLEHFEYSREGTDPGLVIVFNQVNFLSESKRTGSTRDTNEIILCLQRLGYNIYKDDIMTDQTTFEITTKLEKVSKMDLSDKNAVILFFLSHGASNSILCTKDGEISISEMLDYFIKNETLTGKPKIFIFQACKGQNSSSLKLGSGTSPSIVDLDTIIDYSKIKRDILLINSTLEDQVSFRDPISGTWFIQELCKVFSSYGKRDDILSLIMRVTKNVAGNYFNGCEYEKQMPVFVSTLSKKFYLNRNKDRDQILKFNEDMEAVLAELNYIRKMLSE